MRYSIFLFGIALFCTTLFTTAGEPGYVQGSNVVLRAKPASYFEKLAILPKHTPLDIVGVRGEWTEVRIPVKVKGWIRSDTIDATGKVIAEPCPIHTGAGDHFNFFYMAPLGSTLVADGRRDGEWLRVEAPANATGWINSALVAKGTIPTVAQPQATTATATPAHPKEAAKAQAQPAQTQPTTENAPLSQEELAARRHELKLLHAEQARQIERDEAQLEELRKKAEELRDNAQRNNLEIRSLQSDAQRLEALRDAAQAKARLAIAQREKAEAEEQLTLQALQKQQQEAQAKAKSVQEDSARWEAEAKVAEERLNKARAEATIRINALRAEADTIAAEQRHAELLAEAALNKVRDARARKEESEVLQQLLDREIAALQKEVTTSRTKADTLKAQREELEKNNAADTARLATMKQERERLEEELEASRKELERLRAETAKSKEASEELRRLQAEAETARTNNAQLEQQIAAEKKRAEEARQKREELEKQLTQLKQEFTAKGKGNATTPAAKPQESPKAEAATENVAAAQPAPKATPDTAKAAENTVATAPAKDTAPAKKEEAPAATTAAATKPATTAPEPVLPSTAAKVPVKLTRAKGVVVSLGASATKETSHALCQVQNGRYVPIFYLTSGRINLKNWEGATVEIAGVAKDMPNWSKPLLQVRGILRK